MSNEVKKIPEMGDLTALFGALADATRLRIVWLMAFNREELCVCELVDCLEEPQYSVSRHLRELRECGLLTATRDGRWVYYGLASGEIIKMVAKIVSNLPSEAFSLAQANFEARMNLRTDGRCQVGIQHPAYKDPLHKNIENPSRKSIASAGQKAGL